MVLGATMRVVFQVSIVGGDGIDAQSDGWAGVLSEVSTE